MFPFPLMMIMLARGEASGPAPGRPCQYFGSLLGVRARVGLNHAARHAEIELTGLPFAGTVSGTASFATGGLHAAGDSGVVISGPLASAMRVRGCSVQSVAWDPSLDAVTVDVKMPLLGVKRVKLFADSGR